MKQIKLTQGQVAMVDNEDYDELNAFKWFAHWVPGTQSFRAARHSPRVNGKQTTIYMHAVVAGTPKGMHTDHANHDTLDNRRANLRICTNSQNQMNHDQQSRNSSGYKGVAKKGSRWIAQIGVDKKLHYLGTYSDALEAARAYDEAAKRLHGEFVVLNFQ